MSAPLRLFVAVPCGQPFRDAVSSVLDTCPPEAGVRWTHPRTWHLTLQFLGDWPESRLPMLRAGLSGAAEADPFVLPAGGLGAFPNLERPRVLFLHLEDDGAAAGLSRAVREQVAGIWPDGPQDHKRFRAHLTLARIRRPLGMEELNSLRELDFSGIPGLAVEGFTLFSSVLARGGARHTPVAEYGLRKKGEK